MLWTLKVDRNGTIYTVIGRHLILSTGPGGTIPIRPTYPGREIFKGEVLHSKDYKSAAGWKGSKGLVIGTANTGGCSMSREYADVQGMTLLRIC